MVTLSTDITYIALRSDFIFLAVVLDAYSRRVIGWEPGRSLRVELAVKALDMALHDRLWEPVVLIHDSSGTSCAFTKLSLRRPVREALPFVCPNPPASSIIAAFPISTDPASFNFSTMVPLSVALPAGVSVSPTAPFPKLRRGISFCANELPVMPDKRGSASCDLPVH